MNFKSTLILFASLLGVQVDGALKSVCYTNGGNIPASNINPLICTHIIHTFLQPNADGNFIIPQSVTDYLNNLKALKSQNPSLKIMMSFGGATSDNSAWHALTSTSYAINTFANNVLNFLRTSQIDGIDMDWEYPNVENKTPDEKTNFGTLLKQLRITLGSNYLLSTALSASNWRAGLSYDLPAIFGACDFVNIMSYNFNGWQTTNHIGLNAPLYDTPAADRVNEYADNIEYFITHFVTPQNGAVVPSKIILGIPTYGIAFNLFNAANTAPYSGGSPLPWNSLNEDYNSICLKINSNQYTSVLDANQKAPYAYSGTRWVAYESPASAAIKAQYIKDKSFGGAMFWSLESDDYANNCGGGKFPIISTVYNSLNGGSAPPTQTPTQAPTQAPATQAPATQPPSGSFVCPGNGLFKNPADCTKFYNCANGVAYPMACGSGLRFNQAISACDWPQNVSC